MIEGTGAAHAKTILLGEHSVVYGNPAIAFPVKSLTLKANAKFVDGPNWLVTPFHQGEVSAEEDSLEELEKRLGETAFRNILNKFPNNSKNIHLHIDGFIPPARGLGSSAAVAVAIIRAIANLKQINLSEEEQFDLVQEVEKVAHGTPSGLDAYATSKDEPIWFQQGRVKNLKLKTSPFLLVADTGIYGRTSEAVASVRQKREANHHQVDSIFAEIASLTEQAGEILRTGDFLKLGALMTKNHELLQSLDVSNSELDSLVEVSLNSGALGAKLTGGGLGGCIVVLAKDETGQKTLEKALRAAGSPAVWSVN